MSQTKTKPAFSIQREGSTFYGYYDSENQFVRHREDGPAVIHKDGLEQWYKHGTHHRDDGPAAYDKGIGFEWWIQNGVLHRDDGPAMTYYNGKSHRWYQNGVLHREDGPAIVSCGKESYYLKDCVYELPKNVVLDPENQTIEEIVMDDCPERQKLRIERYGRERFFKDCPDLELARIKSVISFPAETVC